MYLGICISCRPHLQQVTLKNNSLKAYGRRESYAARIVCFSTDSDEWFTLMCRPFHYLRRVLCLSDRSRGGGDHHKVLLGVSIKMLASNPGCRLLVAIYRLSRPGLCTRSRMDSLLRSRKSCRNCFFGDSFVFDLVTDGSLTLLGIAAVLLLLRNQGPEHMLRMHCSLKAYCARPMF
jgi:hypothetical protein